MLQQQRDEGRLRVFKTKAAMPEENQESATTTFATG